MKFGTAPLLLLSITFLLHSVSEGTPTEPDDNSNAICAHWCKDALPPGQDRGHCISDAASGDGGPCYQCGPRGDNSDVCGGVCCDTGGICVNEECVYCPPSTQVMHISDAFNLGNQCGSHHYSDCSGAFGFYFEPPAEVAEASCGSVEIKFALGITCQSSDFTVSLNGAVVATVPGVYDCNCYPNGYNSEVTVTVSGSDLISGTNTVSIDNVASITGCTGFQEQTSGGNIIIATITYGS